MPLQPPSKHDFFLRPLAELNSHIASSMLSAMDHAGVGIAYWDLNDRRIYWSKGLITFYELGSEPFCRTYQEYLEQVYPDDQSDLQELVEQVQFTPETVQLEYRVIVDQQEQWLRSCFTPEVRNGQVTHLIEVVHDISDLKSAQQALITAETRWRKFFGCISDVLIETTFLGEIIFATDAITSHWGYFLSELRGAHLLSIVEFENASLLELMTMSYSYPFPASVTAHVLHKGSFWEMADCTIHVDAARQTLLFLFKPAQSSIHQLHQYSSLSVSLASLSYSAVYHNPLSLAYTTICGILTWLLEFNY